MPHLVQDPMGTVSYYSLTIRLNVEFTDLIAICNNIVFLGKPGDSFDRGKADVDNVFRCVTIQICLAA